MAEQKQLELEAVIGFGGSVPDGLIVHPDQKHIIFALGSTVVIREIGNSKAQDFLQGHSDKVSCIAVSSSGRYLASGQVTHMGFQADIILWDFETRKLVHRLTLHKVKIQSLAFSHNDLYLASLGGQDDNSVVIWDVETGSALCGSPAANDSALCVKWLRHRDDCLVTGGYYNLRVWDFSLQNRKIRPTDCQLGQSKRVINCIEIDENDEMMYCGTASGDLLQVSLEHKLFRAVGPVKVRFSQGILSVAISQTGDFVVGGGDGSLALIRRGTLKIVRQQKCLGGVTSLAFVGDGGYFYAGTNQSNIYWVKYDTFDTELRTTCHHDKINCVKFPRSYAELFITSSIGDIRVWNARTCQELLRIQVPNLECHCVDISPDGSSIISGWSDGRIRAFGPQSGKLLYVINDAHASGVTAVAFSHGGACLISGGADSQVRIWRISRQSQVLIASMKEHKGIVTSIAVRDNDSECITASADGSCIVWDLNRHVRNKALFASTFFKSVCYHPDESQILTTGTDRKLTYWDAYDGNAIREIDGSQTAEINAIAITADGDSFVSGGGDRVVKFWNYDEGVCHYVGYGHSGTITSVQVSPDQQTVVSVSDEGAIFMWRNPVA